ncbi:hypothetical protein J6590_016706 [Homalodisca vitripennis]|nr:hypothetical protein J6590_016706 [Homalodisca vitripennis]
MTYTFVKLTIKIQTLETVLISRSQQGEQAKQTLKLEIVGFHTAISQTLKLEIVGCHTAISQTLKLEIVGCHTAISQTLKLEIVGCHTAISQTLKLEIVGCHTAISAPSPYLLLYISNSLNTSAGDVSWRGPARPGKTRSFRINPPEFASRVEAPYSGRLMYYST